jgi:hypothetical protein
VRRAGWGSAMRRRRKKGASHWKPRRRYSNRVHALGTTSKLLGGERREAERSDLKLRGASRKRSPRGAETIAPASRRGISDDPRSNAGKRMAAPSRRAIEILTVSTLRRDSRSAIGRQNCRSDRRILPSSCAAARIRAADSYARERDERWHVPCTSRATGQSPVVGIKDSLEMRQKYLSRHAWNQVYP